MIYNVKDFGATGNGVTNDTAAIQAAVNAAHTAGGGQVYIPAGTYIVSGDGDASDGAIMLYDNITVYGDGMGTTTVKLRDGSSSDITGIFRDPPGVENHDIGMHDLTIDGNRANTTGKVDGWFNGVSPGQPGTDTNITLDHVEIKNASGYGFDPHEETTNLVITNSVAHGNGLDGFTLDYQINATVSNDVAYNNGRHGFNVVTSSKGVNLTNDVAYGNGSDGVIVQRGSDDIPVPSNVVITGGNFHDNGNDGVEISKANNVTVNGAQISNNAERGVLVAGSMGSVIENSTLFDDSHSKNYAYEEIRIQNYDDAHGVSGRIYQTSGTQILNNTISDDGAVRASFAIAEISGATHTTVVNNAIYGTGHDTPSFTASDSVFTEPPLFTGSVSPNAPTILYAPLLGQSNAELMHLTALDGGSGLSHVESGLEQQTNFSQVVTMTNIAVGDSTVDGDRHTNQDPALVWWYPVQNKPGPALLDAIDQMEHQISELNTEGYNVTPIVIWSQGEAEANELGTSKSDGGRQLAEAKYIQSTRDVFNYIQDHLGHDAQFYLMETGNFNVTGAQNYGYPQSTIDKELLGLNYVHDAQVKMADAWSDTHLATNYSDLPMNADVPSSAPNYDPEWASDTWHLSLDSKEIAADRVTNYIALDMGDTHILLNPGPDYPLADLADLTIHAGPGVTVTGDTNNNILVGTTDIDALSGGDGNDVIVGGGAADILTGGAGSDRFYFGPVLSAASATVTDFQTGSGGDIIDVSALLWKIGYTGSNAVSAGYITITQQGANAVISFDQDGTAGNTYAPVAIAVLSNVNAAQFDIANNLVTQFPTGNAVTVNSYPSPWAQEDDLQGTLNQQVHGNLLANNGHGADTDPSGDTLATLAVTINTALGGTAVIDAAGNVTYTPATDFIGTDSFTYTLQNSHGSIDVGTAYVDIGPPPGAIVGTQGNDVLTGGSHNDVIYGLGGNDTLSGGSGDDTIYAGTGNDTLNGNSGNDALYAGTGSDILNGNDSNDILYAGAGNDALNGGNGNDTLIAGMGAATMSGNSGIDAFVFTGVSGVVNTITDFVPANGETIKVALQNYDPQSSSISDFIHATPQGSDMMLSVDQDGAANGVNFIDLALLKNIASFDPAAMLASGNLIITAGAPPPVNHPPVANDDNFTGTQNQPVHGNVLLDNGHGADSDPDGDLLSVTAQNGTTPAGGSLALNADGTFTYTPANGFYGSDSFSYTVQDSHNASAGALASITVNLPPGVYIGTTGDDVINGGSRADTIHGLDGNDTINGGGGDDIIYGDGGNDTLNGNSGNDALYAGDGINILHGNDDNDTLYAGSGTDQLYGDNGNDLLIAATGGATMTGGGGADTFKFENLGGPVNTITDFHSSNGDKIDIHDILQGYDPTQDAISDFVHSTSQGSNALLSVDADGAANGANFTDLVLLQGTHFDVAAMIANGNLIVHS